ncbi:MAG: NADPH:quinone oxidoreductase family protein [Burkholderiales bacterium]
MKAVLCKQTGSIADLVLADVPSPRAGHGEVVVSVKACGVNFPDVLLVQGKYQVRPDLPFSPGVEFAGIVKEIGAGVVQVAPGVRVCGSVPYGAFAEEVVAPAAGVVPIPDGVDFNVAAGITVTYGTSHHALVDRATLQRGESLLVLGASGGVGLAAVELGKLLGAHVIAAASSAEKLATCSRFGADELVNYESEDLRDALKRIRGKAGVNVVFDPVGGRFAEPAVRSLGWRGRYLVIGFTGGEIPKIPLNLALLSERTIVGVYWGAWAARDPQANHANLTQVLDWVRAGRLKPLVSSTFPLARAADALDALVQRRVHGKVVLVTSSQSTD